LILQIIVANLRYNRGRIILAALGIALGLLTNLITHYYFTYMVTGAAQATPPPLPADVVLSPVSLKYQTHPDVLAWESVIKLTANTAAGIDDILAFQPGTQFNEGYQMLEGHWPEAADELAVPMEWLARTGLRVGDTTALTIRYGRFYGTTIYRISGVFDSPYFTYHVPVMNTAGFARAQEQGAFGIERIFLKLHPATDLSALIAAIAPERSAQVETASSLATLHQHEALMETHGDALIWSNILSGLVLTIASLGVMNMLVLASTERMAEVGILKTYGVRSAAIGALFFGEALAISLLGVLIALGVYTAGSLFLLRLGIIPVFAITQGMIRNMGMAVALITFLPPLYPIGANFMVSAMRLIRVSNS
jgi:hypothetical protein